MKGYKHNKDNNKSNMNAAVLYSGGKDSNLALFKAHKLGYNITCLVSLFPDSTESFMFHRPNIEWTRIQASCLNLPQIIIRTKGIKEKELDDLKKGLEIAKKRFDVKTIITGAVRSRYQETRIRKVAKELNLGIINPLWLEDEIKLLKDLQKMGFRVIITRISGYPLTKNYLGKDINTLIDFLNNNRKFLNPSGEGGEYETFVLDMPLFSKRIKILESKVLEHGENEADLIFKKVITEAK